MTDKPESGQEVEEQQPDVEALRKTLEESKKKAAEYYDQLLRLKAEFENFRKRADREKSDARAWGKQEVLMPLISLVDVFEQAMIQVHKAKELKQVIEGVEMLYKSFSQVLTTEGLEPIDVIGRPFDPRFAEAVEQQEVDEEKVGKVLAELVRGYTVNGQVFRHAQVRVGVAKKENQPESE